MKRLNAQNRQFKDRELIRISLEMCKGLHYLHCKAGVQIIHRDLKSKNVLVDVSAEDEIREVKLCDFGVSKILTPETAADTMVGTYYWMAPEILSGDGRGYTTKADIWSYGMVLVELTTLHNPYHENGNDWLLTKRQVLAGQPPQYKATAPTKMKEVIRACLRLNPNDRPDTKDIMLHLTD
eukprot:NODE_7425_length_780_cov_14.540335_g6815_i0.p1 GENE.NODE_7425_length_780_cov_14.540335_g6815_i0~~NODE_7425_length_780_cov_14.540335_g6815_i0.p1  ORF type:complete len:212 (+),score=38.79 NODE_7425_length_780_cov_14.540335_g6815_i0:95-637(+)